jgi:uroporphyrinogen-III decarboxylase
MQPHQEKRLSRQPVPDRLRLKINQPNHHQSSTMKSKERMLRALALEKPDRLPVTVHQWQKFHLDTYMNGVDALEASRITGMDAQIQYFEAMGQFWIPDAEKYVVSSPDWREEITIIKDDPNDKLLDHAIHTPGGTLTYKTGGNRTTTWILEYLIKKHEDVELVAKYMPVAKLNKEAIAAEYDRIGDAGILRGFVWGDQAGCWQHACCLMSEEELILEALDNPDWVHSLLNALLEKKLRFVQESLVGAKFDLIETGGGAGSDTVISPAMHRDFCLPYDRQLHDALHAAGHRSTYHTCGGMMHILDLITQNGTDVSETLSPPGTGGNITDPAKVRDAFAGKVAMIGGMDQFNVLTTGTPERIRAETQRLFEGFGSDGGYICSASDHFFETPVENLIAFADAAKSCRY